MRIEAGKYYRTADGVKVGPMERWSESRAESSHPWEEEGGSERFEPGGDIWKSDGTCSYGSPTLIAEWAEPISATAPDGMTLRDWFAGTMTIGDTNFPSVKEAAEFAGVEEPSDFTGLIELGAKVNAKLRYLAADAMLAARNA